MKKDIESRTDIEFLIKEFYTAIEKDEKIGYIFTEILQLDFEEHIPVICDFWESILLHNPVYHGNVMHKHIDLDKKVKLLPEHFDRWAELLLGISNQYFEGANTDELIKRVNMIKPLMQFKVESSRDSGFLQ